MQLVNRIIAKNTSLFLALFISSFSLNAQTNSPYSRYGIGDLSNSKNAYTRGMGGVSLAWAPVRFVNSSNPATYAWLPGSNGKVVAFEIGAEYKNLILNQSTPVEKYKSSDLQFNYMRLGMQISNKGNVGLAFGIEPISRVNYKIQNERRISGVDSAITQYVGNGSANKGFIGLGYRYKNLSVGFNTGYIFARKSVSTNLGLLNDSIIYYESLSTTRTNYGNAFLQGAALLNIPLQAKGNKGVITRNIRLAASYELQNTLRGFQEVERITSEPSYQGPLAGNDTVYFKGNVKGAVVLPSTLGIGFMYERMHTDSGTSFSIGVDYTNANWKKYTYFGSNDLVGTEWMLRTGISYVPSEVARRYWSNVHYRTGFYYGQDYIAAGGQMPLYAFTAGVGLPIRNDDRFRPIKPMLNIGIEVGKRGNKNNIVNENFFKISLGFSMADSWFFKRRYD